MQSYGILVDGDLVLNSKQLDGYKPVKYAEIPTDFDQTTHYIVQSAPVETEDNIFVGIELHELELAEDDNDEHVLSGVNQSTRDNDNETK